MPWTDPELGILATALSMAAALQGMSGGIDAAPPPDPGSWVSQAQLDEYIAYVDSLVRDMHRYIVNNENPNANVGKTDAQSASPTLPQGALAVWPSWLRFKLEWEKERDAQRDDNWYVSRDDYDTIKSFHRRALEYKRQFEQNGVAFTQVVVVTEPVKDPKTGEPVKDPKTGQQVTTTKVVNVPDQPIRGAELPPAPKKSDADSLSAFIPAPRTLVLGAGLVGGFILLKTWLENR